MEITRLPDFLSAFDNTTYVNPDKAEAMHTSSRMFSAKQLMVAIWGSGMMNASNSVMSLSDFH
jgi:hypothetical protein